MRTETNNYDIYKAVIWSHGMNDILDTINVWTRLSQFIYVTYEAAQFKEYGSSIEILTSV